MGSLRFCETSLWPLSTIGRFTESPLNQKVINANYEQSLIWKGFLVPFRSKSNKKKVIMKMEGRVIPFETMLNVSDYKIVSINRDKYNKVKKELRESKK